MLVRCPQCGTEFRLVDYAPDERVVKYLCPGCNDIVRIDLEQDEVQSSSSSGHYSTLERRSTVLIADDSPRVREQANELLSEAGYNVLLASDGLSDNLHTEEIVELVRKGPFERSIEALSEKAINRMLHPNGENPSKADDLTFVLFRLKS